MGGGGGGHGPQASGLRAHRLDHNGHECVVGAAQLAALAVEHAGALDGEPHLRTWGSGGSGSSGSRWAGERLWLVAGRVAEKARGPAVCAGTGTAHPGRGLQGRRAPGPTWFRRPGMASIFTPREGTAQLWMTSLLVTSRRTSELVGSTRRSSTSSRRSCPGSGSAGAGGMTAAGA